MSSQAIEVIARGVCMVDGHLLLCHGRSQSNTYLPGGHIEKGESAAVALEREIKEELGIAARAGAFLCAVENQFVQKGKQVCEINLCFRLEIPGLQPGSPVPVAEDWLDFRWERLDNLDKSNLEPASLVPLLSDISAGAQSGVGWGSNYGGRCSLNGSSWRSSG